MEDPELDSAATESSTYFLVDASEFAAGSPTSTFAKVRFEKSVTVDPSCVVVPNLNLSLVSSQINKALFSDVLFIIIPASVAPDAFSFSVIILSSTVKFCESIVVVVPVTVRSPWIRVAPFTSSAKLPGESVLTPILPLVTST